LSFSHQRRRIAAVQLHIAEQIAVGCKTGAGAFGKTVQINLQPKPPGGTAISMMCRKSRSIAFAFDRPL
jgi:hypothetical protein